jgi:hypothetical protein
VAIVTNMAEGHRGCGIQRLLAAHPDEIRRLVDAVEDKVRLLAEADPKIKAALYASLGLSLCYEHDRRVITVAAPPTRSCAQRACRRAESNLTPEVAGNPLLT